MMPKTRYDYENQHKADIEKIQVLELKIRTLTEENERFHKIIYEHQKVHNERGAGRKKKLTKDVINTVHKYVNDGKTQREISGIMGLSLGLINKACNTSIEKECI